MSDLMALKVDFLSPHEQQVFSKGDTIHLDVDIRYINEMHGYSLKLTNIKTGETLFEDEQHVHGDHFSIRDTWINNLPASSSLSLRVLVEMDHQDDAIWKEVKFGTR